MKKKKHETAIFFFLVLSRVWLLATLWTVACTRLLHPWGSAGKSAGVGCHFLLQGIFRTQGSYSGLPHCRQTLYCLSHQGNNDNEAQTEMLEFWVYDLTWIWGKEGHCRVVILLIGNADPFPVGWWQVRSTDKIVRVFCLGIHFFKSNGLCLALLNGIFL